MFIIQNQIKNNAIAYFKYYNMYKCIYALWLFNLKQIIEKSFSEKIVFYFKFFKKKKIKSTYLFKKNDFYEISSSLVLKRKFGLLKHKFNEKSFLLYKINAYLDLRKNKKKRIKEHFGLLKKKTMTKLFYKKVRNPLFINTRYSTSRQFKKSKILYNLYNKKNDPVLNRFDSLVYTLISLKLFANFSDSLSYIKNIGVFCNHNLIKNPYFIVNLYDIIQLNSDFKYFYYLKTMNKQLRKHFKKVKPRIFKLVRGKYDINKQSATSIPKWVLNFKIFKELQPNNFEYDYTTLTFIMIYDFSKYQAIHYSNNYILSLYMYRLYNWRYIV